MGFDSEILRDQMRSLLSGLLRKSRNQPMIDDSDRAVIKEIGLIERTLAKLSNKPRDE